MSRSGAARSRSSPALLGIACACLATPLELGCGGEVSTSSSFGDASSEPDDGDAEVSDAASRDSGGSGDASNDVGEDATELVGFGYVTASMTVVGDEGHEQPAYLFSVSFELVGDHVGPCSRTNEAQCYFWDCDGAFPVREQVSGGSVELTGALVPLSVAPNAAGEYGELSGSTRLWQGGEVLTVSAAGAEAPEFETTIVAPNLITMTEPALEDSTPAVISSASPLSVAWENGADGKVLVIIERRSGEKLEQVGCWFDASVGHGTIPVSLLQRLSPGADVVFHAFAMSYGTVYVAGWEMTAKASLTAALPSGDVALFVEVTYE